MKRFVFLGFSTLLLSIPHALGCVGCREPGGLASDEPQTVMAGVALSWSVLTMLVIVAVIIGGLSMYIAKTCQRLDREKNSP